MLLAGGVGLDAVDPKIFRQLGRYHDTGDLRPFAKPKRGALVACCLIEARKTPLDQFLAGMNRRTQRHRRIG